MSEHEIFKVTADIVRSIRSEAGTQIEIGRKYGLSQSQVGRIKRCELWRHIT